MESSIVKEKVSSSTKEIFHLLPDMIYILGTIETQGSGVWMDFSLGKQHVSWNCLCQNEMPQAVEGLIPFCQWKSNCTVITDSHFLKHQIQNVFRYIVAILMRLMWGMGAHHCYWQPWETHESPFSISVSFDCNHWMVAELKQFEIGWFYCCWFNLIYDYINVIKYLHL